MLNDYFLATLCANSYDDTYTWDHAWTAQEIHVAHKVVGDVDVLVCRGSVDAMDWFRDFRGLPIRHPRLGWVHRGFAEYMDLVFEETMAVVGRKVAITGHSLGAARASILAGLYASHGAPPVKLAVFGEPRPGFQQLADIIARAIPSATWYRNGDDPVTEVPALFGRYVHGPANAMRFTQPSDPADAWGPLRDHHIGLYIDGARALG